MSVLEKLLADSWNAETSKAWNELWEMSATAMMKVPLLYQPWTPASPPKRV